MLSRHEPAQIRLTLRHIIPLPFEQGFSGKRPHGPHNTSVHPRLPRVHVSIRRNGIIGNVNIGGGGGGEGSCPSADNRKAL